MTITPWGNSPHWLGVLLLTTISRFWLTTIVLCHYHRFLTNRCARYTIDSLYLIFLNPGLSTKMGAKRRLEFVIEKGRRVWVSSRHLFRGSDEIAQNQNHTRNERVT